MNAYIRFCKQELAIVLRQHPGKRINDFMKAISEQWRTMTPEQKRPLQEAAAKEQEQYKVAFQLYKARLTPEQATQQTLEKKQRIAKRTAIRKKKELNSLGKPRGVQTPFSIYFSEHLQEARGNTTQAKMRSLADNWKNLFSHQKQVYTQLAEDDKIRYKNEMKLWEKHMVEIGRADLLRAQTKSTQAKNTEKKKKPKKKTTKRR